jgi:ribosomal protein S10
MAQEARIKLTSTNLLTLETVCSEIRDIGEKNGIKLKGPHPLPTKKCALLPENPLVDKERTHGTSTNYAYTGVS